MKCFYFEYNIFNRNTNTKNIRFSAKEVIAIRHFLYKFIQNTEKLRVTLY